jgi:hypothetical protein
MAAGIGMKDYLLNAENLKVRLLNKSTKAEVLDVLGDKQKRANRLN